MKETNAAPLREQKDPVSAAAQILERSAPVWAATVGLDGRPQLRRLAFLFARDGALYFLTAKNRRCYAELCKTPYLQISARDPETGEYLGLSGKVCFTEDEGLLADAVRARAEQVAALSAEQNALIAFFLLSARAERTAGLDETPLAQCALPDPAGVLIGITIRKKPELRDRISRILERREAEPPALPAQTLKLYDGALFLVAEAAKALWPRMDIRPIERAAVFETWDERERWTKTAAELIGNAVIDKPEDLTWLLNPETLTELRSRSAALSEEGR